MSTIRRSPRICLRACPLIRGRCVRSGCRCFYFDDGAALTSVFKQVLPCRHVLLRAIALERPISYGEFLLDARPYRFDSLSRTLRRCGSVRTHATTTGVRLVRPVRTGNPEDHVPVGWVPSCRGTDGRGREAGDRVSSVRHTRAGHVQFGGQSPDHPQRRAVSVR